jgi:hypothetical protein
VLGVVHVPVSGKTYYAVAGKGAYVRDADGSTKQIHAKEFSVSDPGLVLVGSASHANPSNNTGAHAKRALHVQQAEIFGFDFSFAVGREWENCAACHGTAECGHQIKASCALLNVMLRVQLLGLHHVENVIPWVQLHQPQQQWGGHPVRV